MTTQKRKQIKRALAEMFESSRQLFSFYYANPFIAKTKCLLIHGNVCYLHVNFSPFTNTNN